MLFFNENVGKKCFPMSYFSSLSLHLDDMAQNDHVGSAYKQINEDIKLKKYII